MCAGHQQQFRINVWAGILVWLCDWQCLREFSPSFSRLLENMYLCNEEYLLEDDGAAGNFSRSERSVLNVTYHYKRIGRAGPVAWPPRSPDLIRWGFYLWGHLKNSGGSRSNWLWKGALTPRFWCLSNHSQAHRDLSKGDDQTCPCVRCSGLNAFWNIC